MSRLYKGLEKAEKNPEKGWNTNFSSKPEAQSSSSVEISPTSSESAEEDDVMLLTPQKTDKRQASGSKRCMSDSARNASDFKAEHKAYKIPKITKSSTPARPNCSSHSSKTSGDPWGFDSAFADSPKGSNNRAYMIRRQAELGHSCLRPGVSAVRGRAHRDSPLKGNQHSSCRSNDRRQGRAFDTEIEMFRKNGRFKHADCLGFLREESSSYCNDSSSDNHHGNSKSCSLGNKNGKDTRNRNGNDSSHVVVNESLSGDGNKVSDKVCHRIDITSLLVPSVVLSQREKHLQNPIHKNRTIDTPIKTSCTQRPTSLCKADSMHSDCSEEFEPKTNHLSKVYDQNDAKLNDKDAADDDKLDCSQDFILTIDKKNTKNSPSSAESDNDKGSMTAGPINSDLFKCQFCGNYFKKNRACNKCGRGFYVPPATPRAPLHELKRDKTKEDSLFGEEEGHANAKSFYGGQKSYSFSGKNKKAKSSSFKNNVGSQTTEIPKKRKGRPQKKSSESNTKKKSMEKTKSQEPNKPVCVLISSSDEEDNEEADSVSKDEPQDKEDDDSENSSEQAEDKREPDPKKTKDSPKPSPDPVDPFERDSFSANIALGDTVMLGTLSGTPIGNLELSVNMLKWMMEYNEKDGKRKINIYIEGRDLTSFKITRDQNPKLIVLGVTQALALRFQYKLNGNGKFLNPGSAVTAERDIVLEVKDTIKDELIADLEEWVTDTLSKEFKNLSVEEAESIITCVKPFKDSCTRCNSGEPSASRYNTRSNDTSAKQKNKPPPENLLVYPPPPQQGGINITTADLDCLQEGEFLNDVIIDFYLKYIFHEKLTDFDRERTHIFSSFFYKRLTQRASSETNLSVIERMHSQVKTWTKYVDIFQKDFIVVPINESSHWYLAIVCFPGQDGPVFKVNSEEGSDHESETSVSEKNDDATDEEEKKTLSADAGNPPITNATNPGSQPKGIIESCPCILVFDSLGGSGRSRVTSNLRNYLMHEWNHKKSEEKKRDFSKETFKGGFPKVPEQDNHCDCGVFLLQYVESFFEDPIKDYRMPIRRIDWFTQERIARKRQEIRDLIYELKDRTSSTSSSAKSKT
ncbi:sentrin-specific protease 6 isoform X2 [Nematostella vectensis]|uniref:sentrin-specific protease 6 isoform X2 n=1 Tax=Nematostella vectensis TaxID=45351 RepID=UPI002076DE2B|nr:sentrin-specific protease 6 isoform X2 [Nematostella vectensis]